MAGKLRLHHLHRKSGAAPCPGNLPCVLAPPPKAARPPAVRPQQPLRHPVFLRRQRPLHRAQLRRNRKLPQSLLQKGRYFQRPHVQSRRNKTDAPEHRLDIRPFLLSPPRPKEPKPDLRGRLPAQRGLGQPTLSHLQLSRFRLPGGGEPVCRPNQKRHVPPNGQCLSD